MTIHSKIDRSNDQSIINVPLSGTGWFLALAMSRCRVWMRRWWSTIEIPIEAPSATWRSVWLIGSTWRRWRSSSVGHHHPIGRHSIVHHTLRRRWAIHEWATGTRHAIRRPAMLHRIVMMMRASLLIMMMMIEPHW